MTVKQIVGLCVDLLQYDFDKQLFCDQADEDLVRQTLNSNKNFKLLTQCVSFCEKELACDYFPLKATQSFKKNSVQFSEFDKPLHEVLKVTDGMGTAVDFVVTSTQLVAKTKEGITVEYSYRPSKKGYWDELEKGSPKMDERLFAYGAIAEFMFLRGMYDEATLWDKRYKDLIQVALFSNKSIKIPRRRWI